MKKYVICTENGDAFNAASKARRDAETIAVREGYKPFLFRGARTANGSVLGAVRLVWAGLSNWARLIRTAEKGSVILVQYPHYPQKSMRLFPKMLALSKRKGLKWIALVHDLDSLRGYHGSAAAYADRNVLSLFDMVICHNDSMRDLLAGWGFRPEQLIPLGLFDYLTEETGFRQAEGIGHHVVAFLLVGRLQDRDEGELPVETGILLILGGMHGRIVRRDHDEAAFHAGNAGVHEGIGTDIHAYMLHAHKRALSRVGHAQGRLHGGFLIRAPTAPHPALPCQGVTLYEFRNFGGRRPRIGIHPGQTGMQGPQGNRLVTEQQSFTCHSSNTF